MESLQTSPNVGLIAANGRECGHYCRGGCGGRLDGLCGEVKDHRVPGFEFLSRVRALSWLAFSGTY